MSFLICSIKKIINHRYSSIPYSTNSYYLGCYKELCISSSVLKAASALRNHPISGILEYFTFISYLYSEQAFTPFIYYPITYHYFTLLNVVPKII